MTSTARPPANSANELLRIPLARIAAAAGNPRMALDRAAFAELKSSILKNGLLQPIAVRGAPDGYEIVGGHRRFLAVRELAHEHAEDPRFASIPALVVDIADARIAAAHLAENINRADLNPLEIAEGIADAIDNGMTEKELAQSLGWKERNIYRYRELYAAPRWLKAFANEVPMPEKRVDENGAPVIDDRTEAPIRDVKKLPGLAFGHLCELIPLYNLLVEHDALELQEHGERFKPKAVATIKKLARAAAKDAWSIARLRTEIKRIKDPPSKTPAPGATKAPIEITDRRAVLDLSRALARDERDALGPQIAAALTALGFTLVVVGDTP